MKNLTPMPDPALERLAADRAAELEAIISATADGLMLFDAEGRIVRMNPVAERLLGYTADNHEPDLARRIAMLRFRWADGREIESADDLPMPRALRGEIVRGALVAFTQPDTGRASWASISAAPIRDAGGAITGVVVTFADVTDIREAQERAEEAGERLANVLDSLLEGYIVLSRDWIILEINQVAAELFGRQVVDLIGRHMWEEFPAARQTHFYDNYARAFAENRPTHFEGLSAITGRWHEVHGYPRGDRIEIYFHDITARKLLAAETLRQREFYNALLEAAPAGICVLDGVELTAKFANQAYLQFLEEPFRSAGITGRRFDEFVPRAREQGLLDLFSRVAATGEPYNAPEYRHEGFARGDTYWRYSILPTYLDPASAKDALGAPRDLMIVAIEVTQQVSNRHKLEALLKRAEEQATKLKAQADELTAITAALDVERTRLAAVIENMPVAVMLAEAPGGRLVLSNRQVEEIWRHPFIASPEVAGYRAYAGFHPDGRPYEPDEWPLARSLNSGEMIHGEEIEFERGDGSRGVMSASSAPIRDREGRTVAAVVSFADITERKQVEWELLRARDELSSLLTVSQTLVSTLDLPQVLALLSQELRALIEADGLAIYSIEGDELVVEEYFGPVPREEALRSRLPLSYTVGLWQAVRDRAPVNIMDLEEETPLAQSWRAPLAAEQRRLAGEARSYLAVPIMVKGQPIGILRLTHNEARRFTQAHERLATAIANQAAIAIENARLYRQAHEGAVLEERQRLARDLHDSVSQTLFGVTLATHNALTNWDKNPERARERVFSANQLAKRAQAEMRALIFELRPDQLATDGLVKALELQTSAIMERRGFQVEVSLCEEPDIPLPVKEAFYRIAQEAINNTVKHARPTRLRVRLHGENEQLHLEIDDDGKGFDPAAHFPGHFGLRSMRERAERIGASLEITSAPRQGSRVSVTYAPPNTE